MDKLAQSLGVIRQHIDFIFDNEESFLKEFGKGVCSDLTEVYFSDNRLKIGYVVDCGMHIGDVVPIDRYIDWRMKIVSIDAYK